MLTHFFQTVQQHVESIEQFSRPHPLSTEAAVASLKRYIPDPRYRIQLSDLIDKTVERVAEVTSGEAFAVQGGPTPTSESVTARVRRYEAACSTLLAVATVGGFWAEEEQYPVWQRALERLGSTALSDGYTLWIELQRYPATLLLYALGIGAVDADRLLFLRRLLASKLRKEYQEAGLAVEILPPSCWSGSSGGQTMQILEGMDNHYAPLNDWIHDTLWPHAERIISGNDRYTFVFDKLEILMALSYAHHKGKWSLDREVHQSRYWVPPGAFGYRHENRTRIIRESEESLSTKQEKSPLVTCGIFGETADDCKQGLAALGQFVPKLRWW